jgi:ABC-type multidrug transport system fused ATPase/permease subunit
VTQAKLGRYSALLLLHLGHRRLFPLPDAAHHHQRVPRVRVRPAQRLSLRTWKKLPLAYFQANRTGDLMSRATNDLSAVRMMVGPAVMYLSTTLIPRL